ncbi:MAG: sugar ABC transporter substrate-binding protein [Gammaproteobacteria bacterium]|nr:sugar ABC transporter substrate-binding protein [Gammaproteobacteria bacterium]
MTKALEICIFSVILLAVCLQTGCAPVTPVASNGAPVEVAAPNDGSPAQPAPGSEYLIGPGDQLKIFVWRHDDVSTAVPVRPDGRISTPLVEDMQAAGKTPSQLARDVELVLGEYIKSPVVTVIVTGFVGDLGEQVRVVGQAMRPRSLSYRQHLTLLDVLIEVGGLTDLAAGRRAKIIRRQGTEMIEINVRPDILMDKGDLRANVKMMPGDVLIIPEARF